MRAPHMELRSDMARVDIRSVFLACLVFFTFVWISFFVQYSSRDRAMAGVFIERSINGKYIVSISGSASDNMELIHKLLRYDTDTSKNESQSFAEMGNNSNDHSGYNVTALMHNKLLPQFNTTPIPSTVPKTAMNESPEIVPVAAELPPSLYNYAPVGRPGVTWGAAESLRAHYNYSCSRTFQSANVSDTHICGDINNVEYKLVFFTTMYYSVSSAQFFRNTLNVIASMKTDHSVQPVMFIESPRSFVDNNATDFIQSACDLGWVVLLVQHCNHHAFPVFKSMFNVTMTTWKAQWYGYSNADMLFDDSLISTLDFIQSHVSVLRIPMVVGRRYNLAIEANRSISHYKQLRHLYYTSKIDSASAVDYFVARKDAFPWHRVPDFVIGRPVYDTWMVWFAQHAQLPVVDTTATVRAIHQNQAGLSYSENTHKGRRKGQSMHYNRDLAIKLAKQDKNMQLVLGLGYLSCLPLKLIKMKRWELNFMVSSGQTGIVGRGRSHYPVPSDDEELLHAITGFNLTFSNDTISSRSATPVDQVFKGAVIHGGNDTELALLDVNGAEVEDYDYAMNASSATRRKLLGKPKNKQKAKPKNNPKPKPQQEPKPTQKPTEKAESSSGKQSKLKTTNTNATAVLSANKSVPVNISLLKQSTNGTAVLSNSTNKNQANTSTGVNINNNPPKGTDEPSKPTPSPKPKFQEPKMIPFIGDSKEYVFVLVRRTHYLEKRKEKDGFKRINFRNWCSKHQNIDMELSELVTF